ncbi:hypothetical protein [Mesorhizobium opportunistum]|uniref:Uncharacterized protein n=1 Tax=Mesorhizobium opportunistum (strain LMG 24607 / HAMBI 3007 / WSM2075) TaxID=536019 RepID=F7XZQ0_MESOW|nr:hypothetical protein [Mesorhizobium opportunistum]AEH87037.1 hypothetical protein Mesop_2564 [Mesorhizobium opportunistum WSM2075]
MTPPDDKSHWIAHVKPSTYPGPISFTQDATAVSVVAPDPLADAIADYRAGMAAFAAIPSELIDVENEESHVMATYGPAHDRLWHDCPPATSLRGVAEAIRYTLQEDCIVCSSAENTLEAALAFLVKEHGP